MSERDPVPPLVPAGWFTRGDDRTPEMSKETSSMGSHLSHLITLVVCRQLHFIKQDGGVGAGGGRLIASTTWDAQPRMQAPRSVCRGRHSGLLTCVPLCRRCHCFCCGRGGAGSHRRPAADSGGRLCCCPCCRVRGGFCSFCCGHK